MKFAVYYRCSTDKQDLEHQRASVRRWLSQQGYAEYELLEFEDEGISGAADSRERPGYRALMEAVSARSVSKVVLFEGSRLSRRMMEYLRFMELADKNGVAVEIVGKGRQAFGSGQEMLLAAVQAFVAQAEREQISQRIRSGLARAKERGIRIGAKKGSHSNRGWRKSHNQRLVDEILLLHRKGLSLREIAELVGTKHTVEPISYGLVRRIIVAAAPDCVAKKYSAKNARKKTTA
jgi:DNA invertase Pin-like site-specific DNA recombinase